MTTQAHTPTPWAIIDSTLVIREPDDDAFFGDEIEHIAEAHTGQVDSELNAANAEFIVRACNAHDELVATLEETLDALYRATSVGDETTWTVSEFRKWEAILAKVKS